MLAKLLLVLAIINLSFLKTQGRVSYEGYKVYKIHTQTVEHVKLLRETFVDNKNFDFWSNHKDASVPTTMMVSPFGQTIINKVLTINKIEYEISNSNLAESINKRENNQRSVTLGEATFDEYMRYDEIVAYARNLAVKYPNVVTVEVIGQSFEGRDLVLVKISSGGSNKPTIFYDFCIHAREWISAALGVYVINQLVENTTNAAMYQSVDWALLTLANPDGYEYTFTDDRMWRKTRSPGTICQGCDANRNFGFYWKGLGSSDWQCDETYAGRSAFSEPEAIAMRDYLDAHADDIKLYISFHSYGNYVLYPWSYDYILAENADELKKLGDLWNDAIFAAGGENYTVGHSSGLLYPAAGCSDDYAKSIGIDLVYTIELPGGGSEGFDLEATKIKETVWQSWQGIKVLHAYVETKYVNGAK